MMTNRVPVILSWIPFAKGGRTAPPPLGDYWYRPIARFDADPEWKEGVWSFWVKPGRVSADGRFWVATAGYLMPAGPQHLLRIGARFELLEGQRVVAHGMIADPAVADTLSPEALEDVLLV